MTKEAKHAPIPWRTGITVGGIYSDMCLVAVAGEPDDSKIEELFYRNKANAEFITRACNSHYWIIEALIVATTRLRYLQENNPSILNDGTVERLQKAIDKAEGKE